MSRAAATPSPIPGAPADSALGALLSRGLLGSSEAEFLRLGEQFRAQLAPRNLLESLQVDLALMGLAMLRRALAVMADAPDDARNLREHARGHRILTAALRDLAKLRKQDATAEAAAIAIPIPTPPPAPPPPVAPPTPPAIPPDRRVEPPQPLTPWPAVVAPVVDVFAARSQPHYARPAPAVPLVSDERRS